MLANVLGLPMPGLILGTLAALGWLALLVTGNAWSAGSFSFSSYYNLSFHLGILLGLKEKAQDLREVC